MTTQPITDDQLRQRAVERVAGMQLPELRDELARVDSYATGRQSRAQRIDYEVLRDRAASMQRLTQLAADPANHEGGTDPGQIRPAVDPFSGTDFVQRARRVLDAEHASGLLPARAAEKVEAALSRGPAESRSLTARWAAAVGDPNYRSAFGRLLLSGSNAFPHVELSEAERAAVRAVADVQRALNEGTGSAGGFAVPLSLDPSVLLTSDGSVNPIRQLARVELIATRQWQGVSSVGVTAGWAAESAEASDNAPTIAAPTVTTFRQQAFVPFSMELDQDWSSLARELQMLLLDASEQVDATAFVKGSGTGQPEGIATALTGGASAVPTASADALVAADVYGLQSALPPRFQPRAQWAANLTTINELAQFETGNGAKVFPEIAQNQLLRKPLHEASHLDAAGDTASAGNDKVAIYGDWSNYLIAERVGATIELVPHLFGANQMPTGQRGLYLFRRVGADVLVPNAFRMLTA